MKLLTIFLTYFILLIQNNQNIRFIHRGAELKPIGTLLISIGEKMLPTDRPTDSIYGRGVKTNKNTLHAIETFINRNKYLTSNPKNLFDSDDFYEIVNTDGSRLYLGQKNIHTFFQALKISLEEKKLDKTVIKSLEYY